MPRPDLTIKMVGLKADPHACCTETTHPTFKHHKCGGLMVWAGMAGLGAEAAGASVQGSAPATLLAEARNQCDDQT